MRKVLAFTVALMIAAIVFAPALGYTIQSAGNQSYTVTSGSKVAYSISEGAPAHNLTADMITNKYSFQAPAVQSTRVPYSFKEGSAQPYSTKLVGVSAVSEGIQTTKEAATVGETAKTSQTTTTATPVESAAANVTAPAVENITAPANVTAPVVEPKFAIEGIVKDDNETGLANWTVNLEQPAGTVIKTATTALDGKFAFMDLAAGEYTVSEVIQMGWNLVTPVDGKFTVAITNESVTSLAFINTPMPAPANVTAPTNATAPVNVTATA
ncbi:MAG: SdrD B-like domain-containing protein [Methanothrix sp.]|nr:SdrD B-like domain-containing protein [Methanothrix sp.]